MLVHPRRPDDGEGWGLSAAQLEGDAAQLEGDAQVESAALTGSAVQAEPAAADSPTPTKSAVRAKGEVARPHQPSDGELVAAARRGETGAFEQLYRRHASYALALAVRVQGHSGDAEDVLHDAFLRVHDQLGSLRSDDSFRAWLSSIVVRLVRTRLRRRRLLSVLGLGADEVVDLDALIHSDAGPEVRAQLTQVYAILNEVPVDQRICWALRYLEGRKLEEVAHIAGCSLATAKRRIGEVQLRLTGDAQVREQGVESERSGVSKRSVVSTRDATPEAGGWL